MALTPQGWKRLEALMEVIARGRGERYRSRILGLLLLQGAEEVVRGLRQSGRLKPRR